MGKCQEHSMDCHQIDELFSAWFYDYFLSTYPSCAWAIAVASLMDMPPTIVHAKITKVAAPKRR